MFVRLLVVSMIFVVGVGCTHNRRSQKTILKRAAFDFECPPEEIELIVIDEEGSRNLLSQVGAHGCEKKAVYLYYPDTDTWMRNSDVFAGSVVHDPEAYHGKRKNRKEKKQKKKQDKAQKKMDASSQEPAEPAEIQTE